MIGSDAYEFSLRVLLPGAQAELGKVRTIHEPGRWNFLLSQDMGSDQKCALIVGFNWKDEFALQRAWFNSGVTIPIRFVADVIAAAAFMKRRERWMAGIVLLEWKEQEPKLLQFLHWLRKEPAMREVIVIMCAHDCNDETVKTAYTNGVDCCVQRSDNFGEVMNLLRRVENYWFDPSLFECSLLKSA